MTIDQKRMREIDFTLAKLKGLWKSFPHLRLGQLLINMMNPQLQQGLLYYVEDAELGTLMDNFYREQHGGGRERKA
jgi:hypothetical protein